MRVNRRSWLKMSTATGLAALGAGQVGGTSGNEFDTADYRHSLKLRRQNSWSVSEWRDHLVDAGADIRVADTTVSVSSWETENSSEDRVSTQELDSGDVTLSMTYYIYDGGHNQIDLNWVLDPPGTSPTSINKHTNEPDDVAAIGWSDNDYVKDGDTYLDNYGSHISDQNSVTPQGVAISWDDSDAGLDAAQQEETTAEGWFGIPLEPRTDSDPDQRRIFVDYYHVWFVGRITGVSFGSGGPSVGFSIETQKWVKEDDAYEKNIDEYIGGP